MATVLLTGAGGGFGRLTAAALRTAGHEVFGTLRDVNGRNASVAAELRALGAHVVEMDVTSDDSVARAVAEVLAAAPGGLDVVVNNAGVGVLGVQEAFTAEDLQRLFDINTFGAHRVTRAVAPHLRERGRGLVLFVSSLLGRITMPWFGPYNASKWAMEALAENYALELSGFGVDVAIVEPGGYPTSFIANMVTPSDTERASALGAQTESAKGFMEGFEQALAANPAQDPRNVADAIVRLVEAPAGTRPFRTVVDRLGMGTHVATYNAHLGALLEGLYANFGISSMLGRRGGGALNAT